jgi:hypothetical protein
MECLLGLLKVRVVRGVHLAICDPLTHSSDPYVVLRHGQQVNCMPLQPASTFTLTCRLNNYQLLISPWFKILSLNNYCIRFNMTLALEILSSKRN